MVLGHSMRFLGHLRWFFGGFVLVKKRENKKKTGKPEVANANECQQPKCSTDARLQNDL